jgi:phosphoribosylformimino-5-aminoimidazole carboxamide ribotide isomerase
MITIIPAIDLIDGKCVRLEEGDFDRQTRYGSSPVDLAKMYEDNGLQHLHLVDLDGARTGSCRNIEILEKIANATRLIIDYGGGINSGIILQSVFDAGAAMATIGSLAVRNEEMVMSWIEEFGGERFILGADVKDEMIYISGWAEGTEIGLIDFMNTWRLSGINAIMCTDIKRDGMYGGPAFNLYNKMKGEAGDLKIIASGGVTGIEDIRRLEELRVDGVIIGKALLEGKIMLSELWEFEK